LNGAKILLHNDTIISIGKFGVSFLPIQGFGQFGKEIAFYNRKALLYREVRDAFFVQGNLMMLTDNGTYLINSPDQNTPRQSLQYKLLLSYRDSCISVKSGDTIELSQNRMTISLGLINPNGVGKISYQYSLNGINGNWHTLDGNEIHLENFMPDDYKKLLIIAEDDIWRSNVVKVILYLKPFWWQTKTGRRIIWAIILATLGAIVAVSIFYTKKLVTAKHNKKNEQLKLELKAIYSQINPHFIINTINTGLYYIIENQNKEAYKHMILFSDLLRFYLKSARTKSISLEEEIKNLTIYISLQQSRFENRFDFELIIDPQINTSIHIPTLLLQPIIENAINHGLLNRVEKGKLMLCFDYGLNDELVCIVDDNGVGRAEAKKINEKNSLPKESYGNELTKDLIKIWNSYTELDINIEYKDKEIPEMGTRAIITIKNINHARKH
jgi:two-component sensor histidine kinase